jgi:hypothetical protein
MFERSQKIIDDLVDDVKPLLDSLNTRTTWNQRCKDEHKNLIKKLDQKKYITLSGHPNRYHLSRIGESCLYDVPLDRRGQLAELRGKRIRLVCVSSGRYERLFMAGVVSDTPEHLRTRRTKPEYKFPNLDKHELVYKSPRYRAIRINTADPFDFSTKRFSSEEFRHVDYVLFDGLLMVPIAVLRDGTCGNVVARLLGRYTKETTFSSLTSALKSLASESKKNTWLFT